MWRRADIRVRIRPQLSAGHLLQSVGNGLDLRKSPGRILSELIGFERRVRSEDHRADSHVSPRAEGAAGYRTGVVSHDVQCSRSGLWVSEHKLGWSAQAGFAFLNRKRVFSELTLHYLGAPGMTVEGFTVGNAPLFDYDILTVSVPRTTVDYRRLAFGIGFGIKLG